MLRSGQRSWPSQKRLPRPLAKARLMQPKTGHRRKCYTMAWETRSGLELYYTRSRRVSGRIVREYIGQGPIAELAHQTDIEKRLEREAERKVFEAVQRRDAELDRTLDSFVELSNAVTIGLLILAGYHQHKRGNWRMSNERVND